MLQITDIQRYRDGGTTVFNTTEGSFAIDNRIGSKTPGALYKGYPAQDNSNLITDNVQAIKSQLADVLETMPENSFPYAGTGLVQMLRYNEDTRTNPLP